MDAYWVCDGCHSLNRERDNRCYHCRAPRSSSSGQTVDTRTPTSSSSSGWQGVQRPFAGPPGGPSAGSTIATAGPMAAANTLAAGVAIGGDAGGHGGGSVGGTFGPASAAGAPSAQPFARGTSLLGALILGSAAALAATALWYGVVSTTHFQVGLIAVAVGWLVAQGVVWGGGGRGSVALIPISVALTFLALAVSEYLIVVRAVADLLTESGYTYTLDIIQPPDVVLEAIKLSIQSDPLTLVFWAIAIVEAFVVPLRRLARPR